MSTKINCTSLLFLLSVLCSSAQNPAIIKVTELTKRLNNNSDTTYIVNFWATWCAPCVAELPEIEAFAQKNKGTKIKMLLVSINYKEDRETKLIPFLKEKKINSECVLLDENNFDYFPRVIDKRWNGDLPATMILNNKNGYKEIWQQKIDTEFLKEKTNNASFKNDKKPAIIKINDLISRINTNSDTTYIVNFWATWCVPCVQELPEFEHLNSNLITEKRKVKIILVSLDFPTDYDSKLIPFIKKKKIKSEVVLLNESNANYFIPLIDDRWTGSIPCTIILNGPKKIKECYEKKLTKDFLEERLKQLSK